MAKIESDAARKKRQAAEMAMVRDLWIVDGETVRPDDDDHTLLDPPKQKKKTTK